MTKLLSGLSSVLFMFLLVVSPALAHVIVEPSQVGVAESPTFSVGVPSEKDNPTIALKLVLPDGLDEVIPNVKSGWMVEVKKSGDKATEIDWTGGSIPPNERDEFSFSAQAPANPATLIWKAYQTYQSGEVVNWDQTPGATSSVASDSAEEATPYSTTQVVNDLVSTQPRSTTSNADSMSNHAFTFSVVALALAALSLGLQFRNRSSK